MGRIIGAVAITCFVWAGIFTLQETYANRKIKDQQITIEGMQALVKHQDAELLQIGVSIRKMEMDYRDLAGNHRRSLQVLEQQKKLLSLAMKAIRNANVEDKELVDQALKAIKEYGTSDSDLIGQPTYEESAEREYIVPAASQGRNPNRKSSEIRSDPPSYDQ